MLMLKQFLAVLVVALVVLYALLYFSYDNPSQIPLSTITTSTKNFVTRITPRSQPESRVIDGYNVFYQDLFDSYSIDGNEQINQFLLLTKSSLKAQGQDFNEDLIDAKPKLNFTELKALLSLLEKHQVFLVDVEVFKDLRLANTDLVELSPSQWYSVVSSGKLDKHLGKSYDTNKDRIRLSFGLRMNLRHVDDLEKDLSHKLNRKCELNLALGNYESQSIVAGYYIVCPKLLIHIAMFYDRGAFFWIAGDDFDLSNKQFGDIPRAVSKFGLSQITYNKITFHVPGNLKQFKFDYDKSRFIECNRQLAWTNKRKDNYKQNMDKNSRIIPRMVYVTNYLESIYTNYWLAAGTLLGWRRDCGVIPHTSDVDFGIWSHEYDPKIRLHFTNNTNTRLVYMFGIRNDSYELRLKAESVTYDLFIVYKHNSTTQWCGYQLGRKKYRRYLLEFDDLCSAEMFNHKFLVPCDPDGYLNNEYGDWSTPLAKKYNWTNLVYLGPWESAFWPNVLKQFDSDGRIQIVNRKNEKNLNITQIVDYV